jgi:Ca2+-binding RTX toxin-like protein
MSSQSVPDRWTSESSGSWSTDANWSLGIPAVANDVTIADGASLDVTYDLSDAINSLTTDNLTTLDIAGGDLTVEASSNLSGSTTLSSGATLAIEAGTLTVASGLFAGTLTGDGDIALQSGTIAAGFAAGSTTLELAAPSASATASGVTLASGLTYGGDLLLGRMAASAQTGNLILDGQTLIATGQQTVEGMISGPGALLLSGTTTIDSATIQSGAVLSVAAADTLTIDDADGSTNSISGSLLLADSNSTGPSVFLSNASIAVTGSISLHGSFSGAGAVTIAAGAAGDIGDVSGTGQLTMLDQGFIAQDSNVSLATNVTIQGVYDILNDSTVNANGSGASGVIINTGSIEKLSGSGIASIAASQISNFGTILDNSGVLALSANVGGSGTLAIGAGSTIVLAQGFGNTVAFDGAGAMVQIGQESQALGSIAGFASGDTIDLVNVANANVSLVALSSSFADLFLDNTSVLLRGSYFGASTSTQSDGHGGTDVTLGNAESGGTSAITITVPGSGSSGSGSSDGSSSSGTSGNGSSSTGSTGADGSSTGSGGTTQAVAAGSLPSVASSFTPSVLAEIATVITALTPASGTVNVPSVAGAAAAGGSVPGSLNALAVTSAGAGVAIPLPLGFHVGYLLAGAASLLDSGGGAVLIDTAAGGKLVGSNGDTLFGGNSGAILSAAAGAETLIGGTGNNSFFLNDSDSIVESQGNDTITGSSGAETVNASGSALYFGTTGATTFNASGTGSDTIVGGTNGNTVSGGGGSQVIFGCSTLNYTGGAGAATLIGGGGGNTVTGGAGNELVFASSSLTYSGGTGAATLIGGGGALTANLGAGGGIAYGGPNGNNTLNTGSGLSILVGAGSGDRLAASGTADDTLIAGAGAETLRGSGSSGNLVLFGGSGSDLMVGGTGNNLFIAGTGNETLTGGGTSDNFLFAAVSGTTRTDVINGFNPNVDAIGLFGYGAEPEVDQAALNSATQSGGNTIVSLTDGTTIVFTGTPTLTANNFF